MSFIGNSNGKTYAPGYFLSHEDCKRETREIPQTLATTEANGSKYVKAGTAYPSNDGDIVGLLYEDIDVTLGNMPGSVVTRGDVVKSRLPMTLTTAASVALTAAGFTFVDSDPSVTRPY